MLKAIVFDFDGVLVDSEPIHYQALLEVTRPFGASFDYVTYLDRYVGFDDRDALRAILRDFGRPEVGAEPTIAQLVARKGDAFEAALSDGVRTYDGTLDLVREAARALPVAIASGATRRDIDLILARLGISGLFAPIVSADQVTRSKPDPETYRRAVEGLAELFPALELEPSQCLAIEDTAAGIESARAAGLPTLGVATTSGADALRAADRVVPGLGGVTLADLRRWYGG